MLKINHNLRPSEEKNLIKKNEENFLLEKKNITDELDFYLKKISVWNTYFGLNQAIF
jgi:hypothetical protein